MTILNELRMLTDKIESILNQFKIPKVDYELLPVKHGLINKSYIVFEKSTNKKSYFLQQIDTNAFKNIEGIMHNIQVVNNHFESLSNAPNHLSTQSTGNGLNYYKSKIGEYWRLYNYVEGDTYFKAENAPIAVEAGRMFGEFLSGLSSVDTSQLQTTIPGFHDINLRYDQFQESLVTAIPKRKEKASHLIRLVKDKIESNKDIYQTIISSCPLRATHNDTKLSNLIFDEKLQGVCVVDYDTIMPGYLPLDFGDSVRTICSTTVEDDIDLKNTKFDMKIFMAFATSFVNTLRGIISRSEIAILATAIPYMPFLMGLRMLTDYLNEDIYYTTQYEEHNFDRAANQLTLFMSGVDQLDEMNNIVIKTITNKPY